MGAEGLEDTTNNRETPSDAANERDEPPTLDAVGDGSHCSADPDAALKTAISAALDAGLYDGARALIDVLSKTSVPADVVDLRERRRLV